MRYHQVGAYDWLETGKLVPKFPSSFSTKAVKETKRLIQENNVYVQSMSSDVTVYKLSPEDMQELLNQIRGRKKH